MTFEELVEHTNGQNKERNNKLMNIIASLFNFAEASGWHPIIPVIIIAVPFIYGFFVFLFWLGEKDKKKYLEHKNKIDEDTNPAYAKWYRSYSYTPPIGHKTIILNEDQWVVVIWDKEENSIIVWMPPEHKDRKSVGINWINAKFEEAKKVKIEDLSRIH